MAPLFDSHCHFAPEGDVAGAIGRARAAGLSGLLAVGGDPAADAGARTAAALAPGFAFPAFGIDRTEADAVPGPAALAPRVPALAETRIDSGTAALGERGLV